jgi:hypothetical protein
VDELVLPCDALENLVQQERLLSSAPSMKKTARSSGACRDGASFDCNPQNINPNQPASLPTFRQRQE